MKKLNYFAALCALGGALAACTQPEATFSLAITPATITACLDEELPALSLTSVPEEAISGKTVEWSSDCPEIVSVDADGVLSFAVRDIEDQQKTVTITAVVGDNSATCVITVMGLISKYKVVDLAPDFDFSILDRNVGAKNTEDPGYYFQFGKNEPVTAETIDENWTTESEGYADWSLSVSSPCPLGWAPMNAAQKDAFKTKVADVISDYEMCEEWGLPSDYTEEEYNAAKKLYAKFGFVPGGSIQPAYADKADENGIYNKSAVYIWTAVANGVSDATPPVELAFAIEDNGSPLVTKNAKVVNAYNVRCVKSNN